jgi:hypothetical protein
MGQWGVVAKSPATGIGYSYYPALWEDSGKIYCKAQGEGDINAYDITTDTWTTLITLLNGTYYSPNDGVPNGNGTVSYLFESNPVRNELIWTVGNFLYVLSPQTPYNPGGNYLTFIKVDIATGLKLSASLATTLPGNLTGDSPHGNWGRNRHKAVIKDSETGRIFLINFYMKQIYEFITTTETFVLVKTWTESIGGNSTDDVAGCDVVCLNGKIYILGRHHNGDAYGDGCGIEGPLEITIADWSSIQCAVYPDYANVTTQTYHQYMQATWFTVGNSIFGYGGKIDSHAGVNCTAGSDLPATSLRKFLYNPGTNTWSDLGTINSSLLCASSISYEGKAYLIAGIDAGSASQATRSFEYILEAPTSFTSFYNPTLQQVELSWDDNSAEESYYILTRKRDDESVYTQIANLPANTTSYNDTDIDMSIHFYSYKVWCEKIL